MIEVGSRYTVETVVTEEMTAERLCSGALKVFGTPFLVGLLENAAFHCLLPYLSEEQGSVGTQIHISHDAPTPVGMKVWAEAEITHVSENGKMIDFAVSARDERGPIGGGTHTRAIIHNQRFLSKCNAKREG